MIRRHTLRDRLANARAIYSITRCTTDMTAYMLEFTCKLSSYRLPSRYDRSPSRTYREIYLVPSGLGSIEEGQGLAASSTSL